MKKNYLIFTNNQDVLTHLSVTIESERLDKHLVDIEIAEPGTTYKDYPHWTVFENGVMIQEGEDC